MLLFLFDLIIGGSTILFVLCSTTSLLWTKILEVKLSSLQYAMLPSTKVSIHSMKMRLPLQLSLSAMPEYPYVSKLRISLAHAPDCKVRITPLSDDR